MKRLIAVGLSIVSMTMVSGCAQSAPKAEEPVTTQSASPSSDVGDFADVNLLYGQDAITLSEYAKRFPQYSDIVQDYGNFLFERATIGPSVEALPSFPAGDSLTLTIFCDSPSKYEVAIKRLDAVVDRTWANDCSRPSGITLYTTAPITGDTSNLSLAVTVGNVVSYRVSVQDTPPASR